MTAPSRLTRHIARFVASAFGQCRSGPRAAFSPHHPDRGGEVASEGVYEGEGVLAKARFVTISERFCVFLGVFLHDDFGRGEATFNRLVQRWTEYGWHRSCRPLNAGDIS